MKNFKASAAVAVSVLVFAISAQVPTVEVGNYTGVGANNLSFNEQAKITGDKNFYSLWVQYPDPWVGFEKLLKYAIL